MSLAKIQLNEEDVGRKIVYDGYVLEEGTLRSYNDNYVFVLFDNDTQVKACRREDLNFKGL